MHTEEYDGYSPDGEEVVEAIMDIFTVTGQALILLFFVLPRFLIRKLRHHD